MIAPTLTRRCFWTVIIVGLFPAVGFAQQNLFNVPSGVITKPGDLFFQQQFNFSQPVGASNSTFDFGLGRGWEAGFNILDLNMYERGDSGKPFVQQQVNPDLLANVQKGIEVTDFWDFGIGGQFGINPARRPKDVRFLNFSWFINSFEVPDREALGKLYVGAYYANVAYVGQGDSFNFLLGYEVPIIKDRLSFQADWIGGNNDIGVAVIGGVYTFKSGWQLSVGAQLPAPRSTNPYGVVIEFTYPSYPLFGRRTARAD